MSILLPHLSTINTFVVGATQGIGLEFVRQLLQDSRIDHLFATYRNEQTASQLMTLAQQQPHRLHCLPIDLTKEEQIANGIANIQSVVPNLHLIINCVGLLHNEQQQPEKALRQLNTDNLLNYFQVNSAGTIQSVFIPGFTKKRA